MQTTVAVVLVALVLAGQGTVVAHPPQSLTRERAAELKQMILLRESGCVRFASTGHVSVVTVDGRTLGITNPKNRTFQEEGLHGWLEQRFEEWLALPAEQRRPGAVKVGELKNVDPNFAELRPPAGGLVLRVTNRTMQWDEDGSVRHLCADDIEREGPAGEATVDRLREPANDFMWVRREEWRAMISDDPRLGQTFPAPLPQLSGPALPVSKSS